MLSHNQNLRITQRLEIKTMENLRGIESFVKAVEHGSIASAARQLGISAAAASQNIARLESQLGVRLLTRTTRRLALTDSGTLYYARVSGIVRDLELAHAAVTAQHTQPQGRLRIAASAAFGRHVLAPLIPAFSRLYPRVMCEVVTTDRAVNHIQESVDISIRIAQQLEDGLVARHLVTVPSIYCASPAYLERAGRPQEPEDLRDHDCLVFRIPVDGRLMRWGFVRDGVPFEAPVRTSMISDDIDVLAKAAVAGGGITRLASFVARPYLSSGQLVEVFPPRGTTGSQAQTDPLEFYLCVRDRHELTPKVNAFMAYFVSALPREW